MCQGRCFTDDRRTRNNVTKRGSSDSKINRATKTIFKSWYWDFYSQVAQSDARNVSFQYEDAETKQTISHGKYFSSECTQGD